MDVTKYKFPKLTEDDLVLSSQKILPDELFQEAKKRNMHMVQNSFNRLARQYHSVGGEVIVKDGLDENFVSSALSYMQDLLRSLAPRLQDKITVVALLLSELTDPDQCPAIKPE